MTNFGILFVASAFLIACTVVTDDRGQPQQRVSVDITKNKATFRVGDETAGVYHTSGFSKPIVWPVNAPGGIAVTRDWPMGEKLPGGSVDHPHQQSLWFCHGDVTPVGMELPNKIKGVEGVDFWSLAPGHGNIVCTQVKKGGSGKDWAGVVTTNEWRMANGTKIMDEKRRISLHELGKARLWVFDIDLHATVCPIVFGDTKEGAMAVRVHDGLREKGGTGQIVDANGGKGEAQCWGRKAAWCDYSGTLDGKKVGIAILDDLQNRPACYHVRNYGLMAANPFGRTKAGFPDAKGKSKLIELPKGEHLRLRYGILVHSGQTADADLPAYHKQFLKLAKSQ